MTDPDEAAWTRARETTLTLYMATTILLILGIVVLVIYAIELGPLVGPGVEQSFGFAASLLFLMGALLAHIVDRAYRSWPLGRKVAVVEPGPVTDRAIATLLKVVVLVGAGGAIAYILGSLIA